MRAIAAIDAADDRLLKSVRGEIARDDTVIAIASGAITRERSCEGKKAYRTPAFAETIRQKMRRRHGGDFHLYFCGFCEQYHVATGKA